MQLLLLAVALLGHVWSQPCAPMADHWVSPLNLEAPRYEPSFKPLHVFSFLDGGTDLYLENTGDTVWITYPQRPNIHTNPPNLTDIVISKGPLADHYTADHVEFRWGPEFLVLNTTADDASSSSTGVSGPMGPGETKTRQIVDERITMRNMRGSDHGITGKYYPLEMQVFFYNVKYKSYAEALAASPQSPDWRDINEDVVALSVLFEVGEQNEELVKITDRLELIRTDGATTKILAKMCFEKILGKSRDYITYPGSLTRAPCTRGVRWIVLVNPLTVSESQLNEFRQINLDTPLSAWQDPVSQDLEGRQVQTNLKQLPLPDGFIPAFHPHGPPLNVKHPEVGGTIVNPHATDAEDAAFKNYWSPFDYTIVDDSDEPPAEITGGVASTGVSDDSTDTGVATGGESPSGGGGGGGGGDASSVLGPFLLQKNGQPESSAAEAPEEPSVSVPGTAGVLSGGGEETTVQSSTGNAPQTNDRKVVIPHIFHLGSTAMFTPQFAPHRHNRNEDNHYHPPSEDTNDSPEMPDEVISGDAPSFKGKTQQALNPTDPALKQADAALAAIDAALAAASQAAQSAHAAAVSPKLVEVASKTIKQADPRAAFLNGKRANKK